MQEYQIPSSLEELIKTANLNQQRIKLSIPEWKMTVWITEPSGFDAQRINLERQRIFNELEQVPVWEREKTPLFNEDKTPKLDPEGVQEFKYGEFILDSKGKKIPVITSEGEQETEFVIESWTPQLRADHLMTCVEMICSSVVNDKGVRFLNCDAGRTFVKDQPSQILYRVASEILDFVNDLVIVEDEATDTPKKDMS